MRDAGEVQSPLVEEISDELANNWETMIEEAEQNIRDVRVSMRWWKPQMDVVKRAAAQLGIPYHTYIKQAAFRRALADLKGSEVRGKLHPRR